MLTTTAHSVGHSSIVQRCGSIVIDKVDTSRIMVKKQSKGLCDFELLIQEYTIKISRAAGCPMQWELPITVTRGSQVGFSRVFGMSLIQEQFNSVGIVEETGHMKRCDHVLDPSTCLTGAMP